MITFTSASFTLRQTAAALDAVSRKHHVDAVAREQAGLRQSYLWKLQHGDLLLTLKTAEAIAELFGATPQERTELCDLAKACSADHAQKRVVLHRGTSRVVNKLRRKAAGLSLTAVGATAIPEALQTAEYMLALNGMMSCSPPLVSLVRAEVEKNHEHLRSGQKSHMFLVSEAAVRTVVGNHEIMAEAVRQMIGLARTSVAIRVVPSNAMQQPLAAPANFELYPTWAFVPTATGVLILDAPNELDVYRAITRQQRECALSVEASLACLSGIADGYTRAADRSA